VTAGFIPVEAKGLIMNRLAIVGIFLAACSSPLSEQARAAGTGSAPGSGAGIAVPVNQVLTPAGTQVELPGMRPQVIALSPDGGLLVVSGKTAELVVINPRTGSIRDRVPLPSSQAKEEMEPTSEYILKPDKSGQASYNGLMFSPDGKRIYLSNVGGSIKVFAVAPEGKVTPLRSIKLPASGVASREAEVPAGLALSADGRRLYVALNLSNRLLELDLGTGKELRLFDVGVAPYEVVLAGDKAYVSNWGGRRPEGGQLTGPAGHGTQVRVDPVRHIASEGSLSIVDLKTGQTRQEILTGLHAGAMALSPDRRFLVVANAGSDTLSVIDTRSDQVLEPIRLQWQPKDLFGASPTALVFEHTGKKLYVCHGTQNAIAVVNFRPRGRSALAGLIPTGWYPGAMAIDAKSQHLCVANIKGIGSGKRFAPGEKVELNSHQYFGTVSIIPVPGKSQLAAHTRAVFANYGRAVMEAALLPARPGVAPRPVPERVGEPSVFKHVIYIIKENRTYDQVLGDMAEGNGDPRLCIFGERVTPNQHALCREFVLLDNTFCSGICSADGHQWADTAFATDYIEKGFAGWPRSYPYGSAPNAVDALAYSPAGFIWDNALGHGKTLRVYGEFCLDQSGWKDPAKEGKPRFMDYYRDFKEGTGETLVACKPGIESIRPYFCPKVSGFNTAIPDVYRAARFLDELKEFERNGEMPNLIVMLLPCDHTVGTRPRSPTPAAMVADNDLAMGQIVEALSRSRFWKDTCLLAMEDDPQAGFDHVSGFRTTAYIASAWSRRRGTVTTPYNQTSILRTIELMLGLPPMNQFDATATPMSECFNAQPDWAPFVARTNNIPLDQLNPDVASIEDPVQRKWARTSIRLPLDEMDKAPEDTFNRILWHAQKGSAAQYPSWAVTAAPDRD
jgi:YVTN family beta-propeller protein